MAVSIEGRRELSWLVTRIPECVVPVLRSTYEMKRMGTKMVVVVSKTRLIKQISSDGMSFAL